jgi:hypothetical protein
MQKEECPQIDIRADHDYVYGVRQEHTENGTSLPYLSAWTSGTFIIHMANLPLTDNDRSRGEPPAQSS